MVLLENDNLIVSIILLEVIEIKLGSNKQFKRIN